MSEIDKFFEGLPSDETKETEIFDDKKPEEKSPEEGATGSAQDPNPDDKAEVRKNRRERRLEDRLKRSEDMNIALNERVKVLSETSKFNSEFKPSEDVPAEWVALYGNSDEAKKAWQMNQVLINRAKEEAKVEALKEFESKQQTLIEEQKKFESFIDTELEALEDEFDVDLTSDAPAARKARREVLELVQKLSPKDTSGNIVNYADFGEVFEIYQNNRKNEKPPVTTDKRKELSARSMTPGSPSAPSTTVEGPVNFRTARQAIGKMFN